jgi:predicted nucleic acid-binding protein
MNGMTENRFVLDTNAVIALVAADNVTASDLENKLKTADLFMSVISEIELFSKPALPSDEEKNLRDFLAERMIIIDLTDDVKKETIELRRNTRLKLPDCIVAATSIILNTTLITADRQLLNLSWPGLRTQGIS